MECSGQHLHGALSSPLSDSGLWPLPAPALGHSACLFPHCPVWLHVEAVALDLADNRGEVHTYPVHTVIAQTGKERPGEGRSLPQLCAASPPRARWLRLPCSSLAWGSWVRLGNHLSGRSTGQAWEAGVAVSDKAPGSPPWVAFWAPTGELGLLSQRQKGSETRAGNTLAPNPWPHPKLIPRKGKQMVH